MSSQLQGAARTYLRPRLSAVMLAGALLALAGCGSSSSTTSSSTTASTPTPTVATTSTPAVTTPPTTTSTSSSKSTPTATAPAPSAGQPLTLEANPEGQLKYNKTALTANAGKVSIDFTNKSPLGHNLTVESSSGQVVGATPTFQGSMKVLTLQLKAGTYKFFCSVPGHRQAGMEGTLTVK